MNGPLREAAVTDEAWARKEWRREWLIKGITAGVLIALTIGVVTLVQNRSQDTRILNVTRKVDSACENDAGGKRCQAIKRRADEEQSVADACVQIRKVGYPCPKPGSRTAGQLQANSKEVQILEPGGDASQPASAGQQPAPAPAGDTGGGVKPPKGGSDGGSAPHNPGNSAPSAPASPGVTTPAGPSPAAVGKPETPSPPPASKGNIELETCVLVVCAEVGVGR